MRVSLKKALGVSTSLALALQLTLSTSINPALACGPFSAETIFSTVMHPDFPLRFYAEGKLGVVPPTYARSYQIVAYRYLNGKPLSKGEQKDFVDLWRFRLGYNSTNNDGTMATKWVEDRAKALGTKVKPEDTVEVFRSGSDYDQYLNCPSDSFKTASATLARLVAKYGADSPICKEWIKGQDAVFCHCHEPGYNYKASKEGVEPGFPTKLPDSAALELRQDRQYQMAAAFFYAKKLDDALTMFTAIAQDKTSPWQTVAEYMVARTLIRKGTVTGTKTINKTFLTQALTNLKHLSGNPALKDYSSSIQQLVNFVEVRLDPAHTADALARQLSQTDSKTVSDTIASYLFALDRLFGEDAFADDENPRKLKVADAAAVPIMRSQDLTDWIWSYTSTDPSEVGHAAERFKSTHSLAWTIAYASKLKGAEPAAAEVEAALARVGKNDPGYATAAYYRAKLQMGGKHFKEGLATIGDALASPGMPPSAVNAIGSLRLENVTSLDEFGQLAFQAPALVNNGYDTQEMPDDFDVLEKANGYTRLKPVLLEEAARAINNDMPLATIMAVATSAKIPANYRGEFAQAVFCRAAALGDYDSAAKIVPALKTAYPASAALLDSFSRATTPGDKAFAAAFFMLKNPGSRPIVTGGTGRDTAFNQLDNYQNNWWAPEDLKPRSGDGVPVSNLTVGLNFLSAADRAAAKSQLARVSAVGNAANYLGKIVIAYAKAHAADPRVPEALAITVKATRLGSGAEGSCGAVSTQAFQILHKSYAGNAWTKKTPYHY